MRKPELAAAIADKTGLTREKAGEVINAFTDQVSAAAARGEDVTLIGFGTFNIRSRKPATDATRKPAQASRSLPARPWVSRPARP